MVIPGMGSKEACKELSSYKGVFWKGTGGDEEEPEEKNGFVH